jgi:hypothetical protein
MSNLVDITDIERCWDAIRIHRVELEPSAGGPESVIDLALEKVRKELPSLLMAAIEGKELTIPEVYVEGFVTSARLLLYTLVEEQSKQDVSVLVQLFLEVPKKPVTDLKEFIRSLPKSILDRILIRLEKSNRRTGLQMLLSLESKFRDNLLHQDYEITKGINDQIPIIFYPKEINEPLNFRLRDLFTGT